MICFYKKFPGMVRTHIVDHSNVVLSLNPPALSMFRVAHLTIQLNNLESMNDCAIVCTSCGTRIMAKIGNPSVQYLEEFKDWKLSLCGEKNWIFPELCSRTPTRHQVALLENKTDHKQKLHVSPYRVVTYSRNMNFTLVYIYPHR